MKKMRILEGDEEDGDYRTHVLKYPSWYLKGKATVVQGLGTDDGVWRGHSD